MQRTGSTRNSPAAFTFASSAVSAMDEGRTGRPALGAAVQSQEVLVGTGVGYQRDAFRPDGPGVVAQPILATKADSARADDALELSDELVRPYALFLAGSSSL